MYKCCHDKFPHCSKAMAACEHADKRVADALQKMTRLSDNKAVRIRSVWATPTQRNKGKMGDDDRDGESFLRKTDVGNKKRCASTLR